MSYQILEGDCRTSLAALATGSVQTCISSPPYWNLRDYGVAGQIGLEPLPDCLAWARQEPPCGGCFVCSMRSVYGAELRRVLADDGTVWVNLGDSYANDTKWGGGTSGKHRAALHGSSGIGRNRHLTGLPSKSLIGIPWRVALALQADGWVLRNDIIWQKPDVMPENATDRCTREHEYLFLLAKKPHYHFDTKAIAVPALRAGDTQILGGQKGVAYTPVEGDPNFRNGNEQWGRSVTVGETRNRRTVWTCATASYKGAHFATYPPELIRPCVLAGSRPDDLVLDLFNGSGTTGQVALEEGRRYVGCELNSDYITLTHKRLSKVQTRLQFPTAA